MAYLVNRELLLLVVWDRSNRPLTAMVMAYSGRFGTALWHKRQSHDDTRGGGLQILLFH